MPYDDEFCQAAVECARRRYWIRDYWTAEPEEVAAIMIASLLDRWRKIRQAGCPRERERQAFALIQQCRATIVRELDKCYITLDQERD